MQINKLLLLILKSSPTKVVSPQVVVSKTTLKSL